MTTSDPHSLNQPAGNPAPEGATPPSSPWSAPASAGPSSASVSGPQQPPPGVGSQPPYGQTPPPGSFGQTFPAVAQPYGSGPSGPTPPAYGAASPGSAPQPGPYGTASPPVSGGPQPPRGAPLPGGPQPTGPGGQPVFRPTGPAGPAGPAGPSKPKSKTPLFIGLGAGALVLIVAVVLIANSLRGGGGILAGPTPTPSPSVRAKTAAEAYLKAISEGRAADALALLSSTPTDASLLTNEVLADSLKRAPITEIVVSDPGPDSSGWFDVPVSYKLGDQAVTDTYKITTYSGSKLISGTANLSMPYSAKGLDTTVNGVKPTSDYPEVFPGSYQFGTTQKYFTFGDSATVLVKNSDDTSSSSSSITPTLDAEGTKIFREKIVAAADACLASKALNAGCGLDVPAVISSGKTQVRDGSLTRTMKAEARSQLENVEPRLGSSRAVVVSAKGSLGSVDIAAECNSGSGWSPCTIWGFGLGFDTPSIDFSKPDLTVTWS